MDGFVWTLQSVATKQTVCKVCTVLTVSQHLPTVAAAATMGKHRPAPMRLANPTPIRLSQAQLDWLDAWRGNTMSRSSAIRLLLEQVMREQQAATK